MKSKLPSIVALGGGNGLSVLLRGIKQSRQDFGKVTVGVAMTDNGGSTGNFRRRGYPALGDARRAFATLARNSLADSFNEVIDGNKRGNEWLAMQIDRAKGNIGQAFFAANKVLETVGTIMPVTPSVTDLVAWIDGQQIVHGETSISERAVGRRIERVSLCSYVEGTAGLIQSILEANIIVLGPGSLYTSVIASVLPDGIRQALCQTNATIIYVGNVSTERGESQGYSLEKHISELAAHICMSPHYCLANSKVTRFDTDESRLGSVYHITASSGRFGQTRIVLADLLDDIDPLRHSSDKLSREILKLSKLN